MGNLEINISQLSSSPSGKTQQQPGPQSCKVFKILLPDNLSKCFTVIESCLSPNVLHLNPGETEVLVFGPNTSYSDVGQYVSLFWTLFIIFDRHLNSECL